MIEGRHSFLGIPVDDLSMDEAVHEALALSRESNQGYALFLNTDVIVKADKRASLRKAIEESRMSLMDGKPPLILARLMGVPLREKVSGSDFVPALLKAAEAEERRVFLLGGSDEASALAVENVRRDYPGLTHVESYSPPMGFEQSIDSLIDVTMRIRRSAPDILIVCLGCPKQELFVNGLFEELGVPCVVCAGATIDFLAKTVKRAPVWVSQAGLEWLYRFIREPRRLFRRYFIDSWHLLVMCISGLGALDTK